MSLTLPDVTASIHAFSSRYYVIPGYSTENVEHAIRHGNNTDIILSLMHNSHAIFVAGLDAEEWANANSNTIGQFKYYVYVQTSFSADVVQVKMHYTPADLIDSI